MAVNSLQGFSKFHIFFIIYLYFYTFFQSIPGDHFKFVVVNLHSRSFSPLIFQTEWKEGDKGKREREEGNIDVHQLVAMRNFQVVSSDISFSLLMPLVLFPGTGIDRRVSMNKCGVNP